MTLRHLLKWSLVGLFLATLNRLHSGIRLPDILTDHMVLQRQQAVPLWGWAEAGEVVEVIFQAQTQRTIADQAGRWMLTLSPMPANSTPSTLKIYTATDSLSLTDILVGEVWLCAGQSNMQWRLLESEGGEEAIATANHPEIRLFNVSREVGFKRKPGRLASWQTCSPATVPEFSGVGYYFGLELYQELGIPVGLINSSYGGSQAEAWTPRAYLQKQASLVACIEREKTWETERPQVRAEFEQAIKDWERAVATAEAQGKRPPRRPRVPDALRDYRIAGSIYENMIEPLIPFGIRGAIWYQGESNEERAEQYELLLTTMISAWRDKWQQGNFPFAIIQLPNFRQPAAEPQDLAWSHLRDRQRRVATATPKAGLIVTIDVGEADDIHPPNKHTVGLRTARWALHQVYQKAILPGGPVLDRVRVRKKSIVLRFAEVGQGLRTTDGQLLSEFVVAGDDKRWVWANARIKGKRKIVVTSSKVIKPQAVRYAFNNNPSNPNLTNSSSVPASPFRTDNWPGPTSGKE